MGSGYTKDGYIDIYLETTQHVYCAGSYVEGTVYVNSKAKRNYKTLLLKLQGVEYVYWTEGSGKYQRYYSNTKNTYNYSF